MATTDETLKMFQAAYTFPDGDSGVFVAAATSRDAALKLFEACKFSRMSLWPGHKQVHFAISSAPQECSQGMAYFRMKFNKSNYDPPLKGREFQFSAKVDGYLHVALVVAATEEEASRELRAKWPSKLEEYKAEPVLKEAIRRGFLALAEVQPERTCGVLVVADGDLPFIRMPHPTGVKWIVAGEEWIVAGEEWAVAGEDSSMQHTCSL